MKSIIYKVINLHNNKIYIGQTTKKLRQRKNEHYTKAYKRNLNYKFHNALRKYGWNSFIWEILEEVDSINANDRETFWISKFKSKDCGYNMTDGGDRGTLGRKCTEETKRKISIANTGKIWSEDELKRLSFAVKGKKNGMYGKKHTEKSKRIMSIKASIKYRGKGNPCAKKWRLISPNNKEFIVEGTLKKFCRHYNITMSLLKRFLNNKVDIYKLKLIHKRYAQKTNNTNNWSLFEINT